MKTWLAKFRTSTALDSGNWPLEKSSHAKGESEEVTRFEQSMRLLDQRLKTARPMQPVPPGLHASVMRAVRCSSKSQARRNAPVILRWLPAPALALLVVGGLWWSFTRPADDPAPLAAGAAALEQGRELTQSAPGAVLSPLSEEMEHLNRDVRHAVEFLVASVP